MAAIDLIVLGILKQKALSAYDIQKVVEYRNISKWVKISTPSIYKKVLQLEQKGYIQGKLTKDGNMAEKAVYSLTDAGNEEFEKLMLEIAGNPIRIFLDFNAVIVNLDSLSPKKQRECVNRIEENVKILKSYLKENIDAKQDIPEIPKTGKAVLHQQFVLVQAIEEWIGSIKDQIGQQR